MVIEIHPSQPRGCSTPLQHVKSWSGCNHYHTAHHKRPDATISQRQGTLKQARTNKVRATQKVKLVLSTA